MRDSRDSLGEFLESRDFYELCQRYRWSVHGASEFEGLKYAIGRAAKGEHCYMFDEDSPSVHDSARQDHK